MELIIGIVVIWVIITVIKALKNADNLPSMDESGNMRCKGCGSSSFKHYTNNDGSDTYEYNYCGKRWTRY